MTKAAAGVRFDRLCRACGIPEPVGEYKFALVAGRQWRFDWAWPRHLVALEIEGGAWSGGRHTRGAGFVEDIAKYNHAAVSGWLVLRCVPARLAQPETFDLVRLALTLHPERSLT